MNTRGAGPDIVVVEAQWRRLMYERVYLKAYDSIGCARVEIAESFDWYDTARARPSLGKPHPMSTNSPTRRLWKWPQEMAPMVRPDLHTASIGSS